MTDWQAEAVRLRNGIQAFLNGDADVMPRATIWRRDGKHSKHDQCPHGVFFYQDCSECTEAYFIALLNMVES